MTKEYPKTISVGNEKFLLRLMEAEDRDHIIEFTRSLTEADLWFMWYDFTKPGAFDEWLKDIAQDRAKTILITPHDQPDKILGFGSLHYNQLFWNRHIGELRVMVSSDLRGRGLGQKLARQITLLARQMKLEKVIVYITASDKAARRMTDYLDFRPEAILNDWIKGRDNRNHDLLIMSINLSEVRS
ncbi:MAG: N-acetyltransferase [Anaerolineaceae bacterium]|nr:MAG: N-acetyltransferase [Anaerolineaceae bacterium]